MGIKFVYKLGKLPQKVDYRTIQITNLFVLKNLPPLPETYDVDSEFSNFSDKNMYANDRYGDCVIAGRAHMTLRFECFEQTHLINITDKEVTDEYFNESGGADSGLVMLDSLNAWRKGWNISGNSYDIYAFAQLNVTHHDDVKYSILLLRGVYTGFALPLSAQHQKVWDVTTGPSSIAGSWGGHCVFIKAYNITGPICVTWGYEQQMTWAFWDKYCDESYAIIDNRNVWMDPTTDPLNIELLQSYLNDIVDLPPPEPTPPVPPTPSPCSVGNNSAKISNFIPWILHRKGRFYYMNPPEKKEKDRKV